MFEGIFKTIQENLLAFKGEFSQRKFIDGKRGKIRYPDGSNYEGKKRILLHEERLGIIIDYKANGEGKFVKIEDNNVKKIHGRFENDQLIEEFASENEELKEEKEKQDQEISKGDENEDNSGKNDVENKGSNEGKGEIILL